MSLPPVALYDIDDAEGFVIDTIARHLSKIPRSDHEELVAEGLVILCDLARRYDPAKDQPNRKPGHVCANARCCVPSFAGYASYLLHRKLLDAWHRMHPEHQLRAQADGSRRYVYYPKPASIDERADNNSFTGRGNNPLGSPVDLPGTRRIGDFVPIEPEGATA